MTPCKNFPLGRDKKNKRMKSNVCSVYGELGLVCETMPMPLKS